MVPFRRYALLSALVVGSMSPDFFYFIPRMGQTHYGHTGEGLFLFCLPASLAMLWVFHRLMKLPLVGLAPSSWQPQLTAVALRRFAFGVWPFDPVRLLMVAGAVLFGAITHVAWDSFTHSTGWVVLHYPVLDRSVYEGRYGFLHVHSLLQMASTLLGAGLLLHWVLRWKRTSTSVATPVLAPPSIARRGMVIHAGGVLGGGGMALRAALLSWPVLP